MPLSTQQEALCQHLEKQPEPTSSAAALIRQLAREIEWAIQINGQPTILTAARPRA
jgi:hypothetical protein